MKWWSDDAAEEEEEKEKKAVTREDVIAFEQWVSRASSPTDRADREKRVRDHLFPNGLDDEERLRREGFVRDARDSIDPMPLFAQPAPAESEAPRAPFTSLYSSVKPAYLRGSRHDGTQARVDAMRERAQGSPFDAITPPPRPKPRPARGITTVGSTGPIRKR